MFLASPNPSSEKMAVLGPKGVIFTMSHLEETFFLSAFVAQHRGHSAVALDHLNFPPMTNDFTIQLFYNEAQTGVQVWHLGYTVFAFSVPGDV